MLYRVPVTTIRKLMSNPAYFPISFAKSFAFAALASFSATTTAMGVEAEAVIRDKVEALRIGKRVEINGATIAARKLLPELYRRRDFHPTWSAIATAQLVESIRAIEDDGLNVADYHLTQLEALRTNAPGNEEIRGLLDLLLTDAFVRLAYHARFGKIDPEELDPNWNFTSALVTPDPVLMVQRVIDSNGVGKFVNSLKPQHRLYRDLKVALLKYRAIALKGGWPAIPAGPILKLGMNDTRMPALRRRLAVTGELEATLASDSPTLDSPVETAVQMFQERHGLKRDGIVGRATLAALNVPVEGRIDQIRATLERCRWVMHDLPRQFVLVNIAGFKVYWIENGEPTWDSAVVVGKPYTKTPVFRADLKYIVLNPTWTVPTSIVHNEFLPAMRRDPRYLEKKRIQRINGRYVQTPGDHNALGRIKLMFPNPHAVYLHDTPSKSLFKETSRSFSHGCVRVDKPFELAALVLDDPVWTESGLRREVANSKTQTITLKRPVPVLILYWTATVDRDGATRFFPDIYSRDPAIIRGLNGPMVPPKRSKVSPVTVDKMEVTPPS